MQESLNQTQGETPSPSHNTALITGAALLGGAALLAATPKVALAVSPPLQFSAIPGTGDVKVLNYALALEALEADLYAQCVTKLANLGVSSSDPLRKYVTEFAKVEAQHRDFLISAIKAANNGTTILDGPLAGATFNFGANLDTAASILDFLIDVEATGVKAYIGAIPSFTPGSAYLPTAAAIQGTEARHTAALIVVKNRKTGSTLPPAPLYTDNGGRDSLLIPQDVLDGVSQYIVLGTG
ncbi:hypothetical protein IAD21_04231 [Abditibacteriota bacterium]|nr:hypothetical protein IAD21_04231 [Abditibacteriota bacterium]